MCEIYLKNKLKIWCFHLCDLPLWQSAHSTELGIKNTEYCGLSLTRRNYSFGW